MQNFRKYYHSWMSAPLKKYEFHKIAIKSYSMCFLIKDNEIDNVFFLYIILSYIIIRFFIYWQFIIIFFFHEWLFHFNTMISNDSCVFINMERILFHEFEKKRFIFIVNGKIYHTNSLFANIQNPNISKKL